MATPADRFQKARFGGITFMVSRVRVRGGLRNHVHEFPHVPGGEIEKLARRLYDIDMVAHFHDLPDSDYEAEYPDAYPGMLDRLMAMFEVGRTDELVIPNLGTIKAVCLDWDREFDPQRALDGEGCNFQFKEDQEEAFLKKYSAKAISPQVVALRNDELQARAQLAAFKREAALSLFQKINDAVTAVQAVQGRADQYGRLIEGKIRAVEQLCAQADRDLEELQSPQNHLIHSALKDLWASSVDLAEDVLQTQAKLHDFTVTGLMSASQVSTAIYGTSERAIELLQINPIEDAFAIPAGTVLRYYADAA